MSFCIKKCYICENMGLKEILLGLKPPQCDERDIPGIQLVKVYSPNNEIELAFIKGILEGEDILYFVHNDHFGTLRVGFIIELINKKTIFVDKSNESQARELIADFLDMTRVDPVRESFLDKIRMFFELVFVNIMVPGRGWKKGFPKDDLIPIFLGTTVEVSLLLLIMWMIKQVQDYIHYHFYI